jgi:hypothetical protein
MLCYLLLKIIFLIILFSFNKINCTENLNCKEFNGTNIYKPFLFIQKNYFNIYSETIIQDTNQKIYGIGFEILNKNNSLDLNFAKKENEIIFFTISTEKENFKIQKFIFNSNSFKKLVFDNETNTFVTYKDNFLEKIEKFALNETSLILNNNYFDFKKFNIIYQLFFTYSSDFYGFLFSFDFTKYLNDVEKKLNSKIAIYTIFVNRNNSVGANIDKFSNGEEFLINEKNFFFLQGIIFNVSNVDDKFFMCFEGFYFTLFKNHIARIILGKKKKIKKLKN